MNPPMPVTSTTMRLKRRVMFSAGHAYWLVGLTDEQNKALFGRWASRYGHGHNYTVEVTFEGAVDPVTGMIVNIVDIDRCIKQNVLALVADKHLTYEVAWFAERQATLENITTFVWEQVEGHFTDVRARLCEITVWESPTLYATRTFAGGNPMVSLTRCIDFAASHRLHAPGLSDAENVAIFGKCNHKGGHGHNYGVEVTVTGEPDPVTGMLLDLEALDTVIEEHIMQVFDHKCLNDDVPEFVGSNPTSENLTLVIWNRIKDHIPAPARLSRIIVRETDRNYFEYAG